MERLLVRRRDTVLIKAYMQLLFTSFAWALSTILIKIYIDSIPPFHLLMGRFGIGALIIFLASPKKLLSIRKSDLKIGTLLGVLIFLAYALSVIALKYTSASKSGFLAALSVLFIPIFESIIRRRIPSKWTVTSVSLSIAGLYMISGMNGGSFNFGDMLVVGCALSYTFYVMILDRFGDDKDDYVLSMIQLVSMFVTSFIMAVLFEGFDFNLIIKGIVPIAVIGIFGTGITMFLQTKAQKVATPESVGIILLGEPLFTLIMSFFILHETILLKGFIGSILILSSLVIAIIKRI